jgi:hypothetical protein
MKNECNGVLLTPYRFAEVNMNDKTIKASGRIEISHPVAKYKCIDGGMIHSFTNIVSALYFAMMLKQEHIGWELSDDFLVYEAIIPPFTLYLRGNNFDIASRRVELIREMYKI